MDYTPPWSIWNLNNILQSHGEESLWCIFSALSGLGPPHCWLGVQTSAVNIMQFSDRTFLSTSFSEVEGVILTNLISMVIRVSWMPVYKRQLKSLSVRTVLTCTRRSKNWSHWETQLLCNSQYFTSQTVQSVNKLHFKDNLK